MSVTPRLPDDPAQCRRLLEDLLRRNEELRQQAEADRQRAEDAQRRLDELERVLDQTAADYARLQEQHAELAETLTLLRRYVFGPRRERLADDPGQGRLFDLHDPAAALEVAGPTPPEADAPASRPRAARPGGVPPWTTSRTSASSTTSPRARRPAPAAAGGNNASARISHVSLSSSRRGSR